MGQMDQKTKAANFRQAADEISQMAEEAKLEGNYSLFDALTQIVIDLHAKAGTMDPDK